jgi:hypothetical protein
VYSCGKPTQLDFGPTSKVLAGLMLSEQERIVCSVPKG